jgi:DNA/RNA-binding domain of Phe-tRNA-synthetase-like protein
MSDATVSAEIIPFPGPRRPEAVPAPDPVIASAPTAETDPQLRLRNALAKLQTALEEQRDAVSAWRGALADLGGSVGTLRTSFETLQGRLETLKTQLPR